MSESQPRALIVSVYGLYARSGSIAGSNFAGAGGSGGAAGGWLPVAGLIRLLAELDVDEPAVRSAISRLKRRGVIEAARRQGVAGYELSTAGRDILREGDERIFAPPAARLADGWLLAVFSVPESERAKRHTLRSRLAALGFGTTAPGVWIAPAHRHRAARALLDRLGLAGYVDLFRADYLDFGDLGTAVKQWWDLDAVRAEYERFVAVWSPPAAPVAAALSTWVRVVTEWRRLPYLDPGLPPELLPLDWPGPAAVALFRRLRADLEEPAEEQARRLL